MGRLIAVIMAAALAGCATQAFKSSAQYYRPKGDEKTVEIKGAVFVKPGVLEDDRGVGIYFDEKLQIEVPLNKYGNGEAGGRPYNGKSTSATCNSEPTDRRH